MIYFPFSERSERIMKPDTRLDYAAFQLSPKRSRCELFVSSNGNTEKLASGLVKPFVAHLKVAEDQVALAVQSIKLKIDGPKDGEFWFTKGTLERFVRFVSTPEVLELINTLDSEMSQLEGARRIYSGGALGHISIAVGGGRASSSSAPDETKKELLRAIDVRLVAVKQDLTAACARAAAAGFIPDAVSDLQMFADKFGASRLYEACSKFLSLCQRRHDLINQWKTGLEDQALRSSYGSDMSIDDDPTNRNTCEDRQGQHDIPSANREAESASRQRFVDQSKPLTCLQPTLPLNNFPSQGTASRESILVNDRKEDSAEEPLPQTSSLPAARRLSVQDRINLFENKQKESSGGGKPKSELRRLSSDVSSVPSAVEKAVLRRWSGASDMSLDLTVEKKETESPLCTPSSSLVLQDKIDPMKPSNDTRSSVKTEVGDIGSSKLGGSSGIQIMVSSSALEDSSSFNKSTSMSSSLNKAEKDTLKVPSASQTLVKPLPDDNEHGGTKKLVASEIPFKSGDVRTVADSYQAQGVGYIDHKKDIGSDDLILQSRVRDPLKTAMVEGVPGSKIREAFAAAQHKMIEASKASAEMEEVSKLSLASKEKHVDSSDAKLTEPLPQKIKVQKPISAHGEIGKSQAGRGDNIAFNVSKETFFGKSVSEDQEGYNALPMSAPEQVQKPRQSKGNQELNDELKMKANELEMLFAEHKLRVPADQSTSTRRGRSADMDNGPTTFFYKKQVVGNYPAQFPENNSAVECLADSRSSEKLTTTLLTETTDGEDYADALNPNFTDLTLSDDSRGKLYEIYMQKRDERLREVWDSKRAEKEERMKAMHDSFERSRAEIKAKLLDSAERQNSAFSSHRRAERLRSFNTWSSMKREQWQPLNFGPSDDDEEDPSEVSEKKPFDQDMSFGEASIGNGISRSSQSKRLLLSKPLSTSTPRPLAVQVPRSAIKATNSGKRRMQSDNLLAQSVPNFSNLKKANAKLSSISSKTTARPQLRNFVRSKSTNEEVPVGKEDKPRQSQSLRKSFASSSELKDTTSMNSEVLATLKFEKDQTEHGVHAKLPKSKETKPFIRKNNGIGLIAGAGVAKAKVPLVPDAVNFEEDYDKISYNIENCGDVVKEDEEEELGNIKEEGQGIMDPTDPGLSQESERLMNSESENGEVMRSFLQVEPSLVSLALPNSVHSTLNTIGSVQESPGESPMSWNYRNHHPFSYPHEASDFDASVDSPLGSPASWNLHNLNQTEADAARMRKKWGSAQKPILLSQSSGNQSRKDMTKGFKRLLKFGRKSRGSESLVDWISATTSEGDDDTEDGREPGNRSSEDLRKSRMGFSHGHPSEVNFNESDFFGEQVQALSSSIPAPTANFRLREDHLSGSSLKGSRSFFSLSTFRSKGSDSKPR